MTNYSDNPADVRVDFFRPSGKWYLTESVKWTGIWNGKEQEIHNSFIQSLKDHFKDTPNRLSDMDAICLEPYHEYSHPIQIKAGGWNK